MEDNCAVETLRGKFGKNVTEPLSEKVTSRETITSKNVTMISFISVEIESDHLSREVTQ